MKRFLSACLAAAALMTVPVAGAQAQPAGKRTTSDAPALRVATYNVCKVNCKGGTWSWSNRRMTVARILSALEADVIAVQETPTLPYNGTTQWADLAGLMAARGLRVASMEDGCSEGCTRDSHLYYKPESIEVLQGLMGPTDDPAPPQPCMKYWERRDNLSPRPRDPWYHDWYELGCRRHLEWEPTEERATGMISQRDLSGIAWGGIQDRNLSWAFMRQRATGRVFLAVSVHLPNEKTALGERIRRTVSTNLPGWAAALTRDLGHPDIPVVVAGDLNSYQQRQPAGAQAILAKSGYTDGFDAKDRVNERYATVNKNGVINARFGGWPTQPYKYNRSATRIDYVFARGMVPQRYELFIRLNGDGTFDERYRASDHNPVITTWTF